jgi:hypothetical protein
MAYWSLKAQPKVNANAITPSAAAIAAQAIAKARASAFAANDAYALAAA